MSVRMLQRKCGCGNAAPASGECEACKKKGGALQRRALDGREPAEAPPLVHQTLQSAGRPLDAGARAFLELRLGAEFERRRPTPLRHGVPGRLEIGPASDGFEREADRTADRVLAGPRRGNFALDLSRVRIHADARAGASAQAVDARAYTVGNDIVFNHGQYRPETSEGRWLLAHELTHVAQQQQRAPLVQRNIIGDFFRGIARLFGAEDYSDQELQAYLKTIDRGKTEGSYDSDNKARAITNAWRLGGSPYVLTAQRKAVMIREMQEGYTSGADENAILELLERSYNFELTYMFGAGGLTAKGLNSDFSGDNFLRLQAFYEDRFEGGMDALLKGSVKPAGFPIPLGTVLPKLGETGTPIDSLPGASPAWNEECVAGILCTQDQSVLAALPGLKVLKTQSVIEHLFQFDGTSWKAVEKEHAAFSNSKRKIIGFKLDTDCGFAAASMVHEVRHQQQPDQWTTVEKEKDAYRFETEWAIQRGIPAHGKFRKAKAGGGEEVDVPEIEKYVVSHYSGATAVGEQIIGHTASGDTEVRLPDGTETTRPPQTGDSHQDFQATDQELSNAPEADRRKWVCPK